MSNKTGDPYENLAHAIIIQAAADYRMAIKTLNRNRKDKDALLAKAECERLFQSGWFTVLTDVNGEWLMRKLREEVQTG